MSDSHNSHFLDDPDFQSLLVGCLEAIQRGEAIDQEALAKDFPKYAEEIGQFLDDQRLLEELASKFSDVPSSPTAFSPYKHTIGSRSNHRGFGVGETVRYIGEYEVLDEIARGGMGVVFKARQRNLNRTVALKMILAGRLANASDIERFQREARATGRLKHPGIVSVYEVGEHEGQHFFTMDFVEGRSLAEHIRDETYAPRAAAELVQSIASAVHFAHDQGTVHRDLKPNNILLDESGKPRVTDFGLAKMLGGADDETLAELTESGQVLGTPSYMSPEQASGKQQLVGPASDIYSLGAILYACLCGRAPFVAESSIETLRQVINIEPLSPRVFSPGIPKDLENICLKCLVKEPHRRYGTAQELADDLQRYLQGHPVLARPISRFAKTYRWTKRNPWMAATASLLLLVALMGPVVAFRESTLRSSAENNLEFAQSETQRANESAEAERTAREFADEETRRANENAAAERRARQVADEANARSKFFLARAHWDAGRARQAVRALEEIPADHRSMEWNLAYRKFVHSGATLYGHTSEVDCVDVSPDERWIVSSSDGELRVWNLATMEQHLLIPTDGRVMCMRFFDDSQRLLVGIGSQIVVYEPVSGRKLRTLEETGAFNQVRCFAMSPDERLLVVGTGSRGHPGKVSFWDFPSGTRTKRIDAHESGVYRIDVSPDKRLVATIDYSNQCAIRQAVSGEHAWRARSRYTDVKFHLSGDSVALLGRTGNCVLHDVFTGSIVDTFAWPESSRGATKIDWSPAGTSLAMGTVDARLETVVLSSRSRQRHLGHLGAIHDIAYCSDDGMFVTAGADRTVRVWGKSAEAPTLAVEGKLPAFQVPSLTNCINLAWTPNGGSFATASVSNQVRIWDANTLELQYTTNEHPDFINDISFHPSGTKLASACADKMIRTWKVGQAEPLLEMPGHRGFLSVVKWSPDGKLIASGDQNGEIRLWNAGTGKLIRSWTGANREKDWIQFSSNAEWIASISDGGFVEIRNSSTGEIVRKIKPVVPPACLTFAPRSPETIWVGGGSYLTHGFEAWDIASGRPIFRKSLGANELITGLSFSADQDRLLSVDFMGTVKLWDTDTWEELWQFEGDKRRRLVRFSPTDDSFACTTYSSSGSGFREFANPFGIIQIWNTSGSIEVVRTYSAIGHEIQTAGFTSDGTRIVGISKTGSRICWDRHTGEQLAENSVPRGESIVPQFKELIAVPFDDRIRVIDLSHYGKPWNSRTHELTFRIRELSNRMKIDGRRRQRSVGFFELGWLIERGGLSEMEKNQLLRWLAQRVSSLKARHAERYSQDEDLNLSFLLPNDVRRAIEKHSLDDPKWLEKNDHPSETQPSLTTDRSSYAIALEIEKQVQQASDLQSQQKYDESRESLRQVLEVMKGRTDDPFETLARIGGRKNAFSIYHLLYRLAELESAARRPKARSNVLRQLSETIRSGMRQDDESDWRRYGEVLFELGEFERSGEAFDRYLEMSNKQSLIPALGESTSFLEFNDFYLVYRVMRTRNMRPVVIDGELGSNGIPMYRAKFEAIEGEYTNYFGISKNRFVELSELMKERGLELVHEDRFEFGGQEIVSAIWERP